MATAGLHGQTIANMNWGSGAQGITGDSDVSTQGTLVQALNFGSASPTVNGVTFSAALVVEFSRSSQVGTFTLTETDESVWLRTISVGGVGLSEDPLASLSSDYKALFTGGANTVGENPNTTMQLFMPGLTIGNTYLFQIWVSDGIAGILEGNPYWVTDTIGLSLSSNPSRVLGGLGQYGTGTFTASDTTMFLEFSGPVLEVGPLINAVQLRDISAIPEPSTYVAIFGLGALVYAATLRRRTNSKSSSGS
jgi:hypothetical protein